MATQRLTMATVAGASAVLVTALFRTSQNTSDAATVDWFCAGLRE
jgi:hypothetical protein